MYQNAIIKKLVIMNFWVYFFEIFNVIGVNDLRNVYHDLLYAKQYTEK